jgi:hypothetical protein
MSKSLSPVKLFCLNVGGREIPVYLNDEVEPYGEFRSDVYEIHIHPDCLASKELFQRILKHECLHACIYLSGLAWGVTDDIQEMLVRMMDGMGWEAGALMDKKSKEAWKLVSAAKKSNKTKAG